MWSLLPVAGLALVHLDVNGERRSYYLHVPDGVGPGSPLSGAPLMVVFHGGGGCSDHKGKRMHALTGFDTLADREGFVVVFPSALGGDWNDGRGEGTHDDLAYVDALLADVLAATGADPHRVYAAGFSNGGFFAQRLACERSGVFAAVASVAGTQPDGYVCEASAEVPVLFVSGTADPVVPYDGGPIAPGGRKDRGVAMSVDAVAAGWVARNACEAPPVHTDWRDAIADGTSVHEDRWCGGDDAMNEVRRLQIDGGGHTWPGGPQFAPKAFIGPVSHELDAAAVIWTWARGRSRGRAPASGPG